VPNPFLLLRPICARISIIKPFEDSHQHFASSIARSLACFCITQGDESKALAIHKPRFVIPLKPSSDIIKPLGTLEREALPKNKMISDMGRVHPSLVPPMRGTDGGGRRFLSPRDFQRIMQSKNESEKPVSEKGGGGGGSGNDGEGDNGGGDVSNTFLTQDPADHAEAEADEQSNPNRPWLNKGNRGGTWRPRPAIVMPKVLKSKPQFDPVAYVKRAQDRKRNGAEHRASALLTGKDPALDPGQWRLRCPPPPPRARAHTHTHTHTHPRAHVYHHPPTHHHHYLPTTITGHHHHHHHHYLTTTTTTTITTTASMSTYHVLSHVLAHNTNSA
jgi:hypothetical protein